MHIFRQSDPILPCAVIRLPVHKLDISQRRCSRTGKVWKTQQMRPDYDDTVFLPDPGQRVYERIQRKRAPGVALAAGMVRLFRAGGAAAVSQADPGLQIPA